MNVLLYAPQMADYGGIERHVCSLSVLLARNGHRVNLVTTSNSLGPDLRAELDQPGITLRELPAARRDAGRVRKLGWLLAEAARARRQSWDIIYTNGQSALARVLWWAAGPRTRCIHHHHTSADAKERSTWSPFYRQVLRNAPELVACCRATQREIHSAVQRGPSTFIPVLALPPMPASAVHDRPAGRILRFGYAGRLIAEKGIDAICRLSAEPDLADVEWHIHGAGAAYPPEFFKRWPKVVYHGAYRGSRELADLLSRLDAMVLFSHHAEGLPLTLSEGMSAGLPWIGTDRGGTAELALSPADSVVVPQPATYEQLRAATRELADRIRQGRTSRVTQRRHYDAFVAPDVVGRRWLAYLETGATLPDSPAAHAPQPEEVSS